MYKDMLYDKLELGDVVLSFVSGRSSYSVYTGLVVGFTPKTVKVITNKYGSWIGTSKRAPHHLLKHSKIPKQDLTNIPEEDYEKFFKEVVVNL